MPTVASCLPRALLRPPLAGIAASPRLYIFQSRIASARAPRSGILVAASAASFDELDSKGWSPQSSKKSLLSDLIQEIEPLDLNLIQKDVPAVTVDAMKRTISGMLGILPSDRFNVVVEALWKRLFKLLVSSMMTGYTLRNAEYRLSLERNLETFEDHHNKEEYLEKHEPQNLCNDYDKLQDRTPTLFDLSEGDDMLPNIDKGEVSVCGDICFEGSEELTLEAREYIRSLKFRLSSVEKELHEVKRKNSALQLQQFVGEEKNDLLDYLRSLQPEKVLELSEPTSSEVQEVIHSVAHGLLATLSPKMHSKLPFQSDSVPGVAFSFTKDECKELLENASIQLHPLVTVPRDYLARLLFWCLLMGHYLRGLEHRLELKQLLTIAGDPSSVTYDDLFS
ncbi:hypothetical protein AXF42_Ash020813 [Apostasia shenzhenica]|uniref:MAR-binding filament-like protein 1 n=1 Tax=Apostasia shenzhenica TaxID=1088818 RepID=A0A2I0AZP5_9ASPA|nr:hypothetical protein AXF42_Ash020813 [Apostasia shenzhenica]